MDTYIFGIMLGVLFFPYIAFVVMIPLFIRSYRKYDRVIFSRSIVNLLFSFYIVCSYAVVLFPFPSRAQVAALTGPTTQLQLFEFIRAFVKETIFNLNDQSTWIPSLKQGVFIQPFFNIVLTIPFGMFLTYVYKKSFRVVALLSICLTITFEVTQVTAVYGIFPRPYRLFDVDDLLLNFTGAMIGFGIGSFLNKYFPESIFPKKMFRVSRKAQVSFTRRFISHLIDSIVLLIISIPISFIMHLIIDKIKMTPSIYSFVVTYISILTLLLYFIILTAKWEGQTVGKKLVKIKVVDDQGQVPSTAVLTKRYLHFYLIPYGLFVFYLMCIAKEVFTPLFSIVLLVVTFFACILAGLLLLFKKDKRFGNERRSCTRCVSTINIEN